MFNRKAMILKQKFHMGSPGRKRFNTKIDRHFWSLLAHGPFQSLHAGCLPLPKSPIENSIHRRIHGRKIGRVSGPIPRRNRIVTEIFQPLDGGSVRCRGAARQNWRPSQTDGGCSFRKRGWKTLLMKKLALTFASGGGGGRNGWQWD